MPIFFFFPIFSFFYMVLSDTPTGAGARAATVWSPGSERDGG